jgi:hypothetical protein
MSGMGICLGIRDTQPEKDQGALNTFANLNVSVVRFERKGNALAGWNLCNGPLACPALHFSQTAPNDYLSVLY